MTKRSKKELKRSKKKKEHEEYLKQLFAKYGHGLVLNSKKEAPGNKYYDSVIASKQVDETSN